MKYSGIMLTIFLHTKKNNIFTSVEIIKIFFK